MRGLVPVALAAAFAGAALVASPAPDREPVARTDRLRRAFEEPVPPAAPPVVARRREAVASPFSSRARGRIPCSTIEAHVGEIAVSPDGRFVAAGSGETLRVWDARSLREVLTREAHVLAIRCLAWSADSTRVATAGGRKIRIWNVTTGADPVAFIAGYPKRIAFGPDALLRDGDGGLWDPVSGRSLLPPREEVEVVEVISADHSEPDLDTPFEGPSNGAAIGLGRERPERDALWSPDRAWAVVGDRLIPAASVDVDRQRGWLDEAVTAPNGTTVLTVDDGHMVLWNATTGYRIATLDGDSHLVAFSADSRWICSGPHDRDDRTLQIRDGWTGVVCDVIELPAPPTCLAATDEHVWIGCGDGMIRRLALPR